MDEEAKGYHPAINLWNEKGYRRLVEVGVLGANLTMRFLAHCENLEEYYLVDPWRPYEDGGSDSKNKDQGYWDGLHEKVCRMTAGKNHSHIWRMPSVDAAALFKDGYLDMVYIDGSHAYEAVLEDVGAWVTKIRDGGMLSGDDYCAGWQTVVRGINAAIPDFDVKTNRTTHSFWFYELDGERKRSICENARNALASSS